MNEDETVSKYYARIEETVNSMKGLGEKFDEDLLVQKILRSLLERFNPKVSAIEELSDLKTLPMDQLLGILTAYEMRIGKDKSTSKEASFKANKDVDSEMDVAEEIFLRRMKKGSGKYKGKLPFECFKCGKIGHFASKCPLKHKRQTSNDDERYSFNKYSKEAKQKRKSCV